MLLLPLPPIKKPPGVLVLAAADVLLLKSNRFGFTPGGLVVPAARVEGAVDDASDGWTAVLF